MARHGGAPRMRQMQTGAQSDDDNALGFEPTSDQVLIATAATTVLSSLVGRKLYGNKGLWIGVGPLTAGTMVYLGIKAEEVTGGMN